MLETGPNVQSKRKAGRFGSRMVAGGQCTTWASRSINDDPMNVVAGMAIESEVAPRGAILWVGCVALPVNSISFPLNVEVNYDGPAMVD